MSPIVELKHVHKSFGAVQVLKGVSLAVDKGEVVAVIDQSGSGKSTALRCMNRLESIDDGELTVCGHALHDRKLDLRPLRRDVGIVFQSYNLFPHLTVEENVTLAPRIVKGYIDAAPFQDGFDVVISNGVINLATDKAKVFKEAARLLRPGGQLAIADIVTTVVLPESISCNATLWAAFIGGAWQVDLYKQAIESAGLKIVAEQVNDQYRFLSDNAQGATKKFGVKSISLRADKL